MKNALVTFFLVFLVMGGMRFFNIKVFENDWIEALGIGILIAALSFLLEKLRF